MTPQPSAVSSVRVTSGACPILKRETYALWRGDVPVVPATSLLRRMTEDGDVAPNTVRLRAYGLLVFWRFLEERGEDFWDVNLLSLRAFKTYLVTRIGEPSHIPVRGSADRLQRNPAHISHQHANSSLEAVRLLFDGLMGLEEADVRPGVRTRAKGEFAHLRHQEHRYHKVFRVRVPAARRKPLGLSGGQCRQVWEYLEGRYPKKPAVLATKPVTRTQWNRWRAAERKWDRERMMYHRNRALWAFMLMTGVRVGEVCRVREEDFLEGDGLLRLVDRAEDRHLGDLKTGEGEIYFGRRSPFLNAISQWDLYGLPLADAILKRRDKGARCFALFRSANGGPLTVRSVERLMQSILVGCELWKQLRRFSPHITRHTTASLMGEKGVPLNVVQAFLRHQSVATTERYVVLRDPSVRASLQSFFEGLGDILPPGVPQAMTPGS